MHLGHFGKKISKKYCNKQLLHALEPWCSNIYLTMPNPSEAQAYILEEQKNTKIDIVKKIHPMKEKKYNDILVEFDASHLNENNTNSILFNLPEILSDSGDIGEFELNIFKIKINKLKAYEDKLIKI